MLFILTHSSGRQQTFETTYETEKVHIPYIVWKACWLERLLNKWVMVERCVGDELENIFNWPARKMTCSEKKI